MRSLQTTQKGSWPATERFLSGNWKEYTSSWYNAWQRCIFCNRFPLCKKPFFEIIFSHILAWRDGEFFHSLMNTNPCLLLMFRFVVELHFLSSKRWCSANHVRSNPNRLLLRLRWRFWLLGRRRRGRSRKPWWRIFRKWKSFSFVGWKRRRLSFKFGSSVRRHDFVLHLSWCFLQVIVACHVNYVSKTLDCSEICDLTRLSWLSCVLTWEFLNLNVA